MRNMMYLNRQGTLKTQYYCQFYETLWLYGPAGLYGR